LASIDFDDFEPKLIETKFATEGKIQKRSLVNDSLFNVEAWKFNSGASNPLKPKKLQIIAVITGQIEIKNGNDLVKLRSGEFCLIPACLEQSEIFTKAEAMLLLVEAR
jgi:mannose-6-phosphate isomerase class I